MNLEDIKKVSVIGGGIMGSGIAMEKDGRVDGMPRDERGY